MKSIKETLKESLHVVAHPYRSLWRATDWLMWGVISKKQVSPEMPAPTVEAYERLFRGNLHGHWDDCEGTVSPIDTYLAFMPDEQGR
jgi:hypothetical protein